LRSLGEEERGEATRAPSKLASATCPNCHTEMPPGAVLCLKCGFHTRLGRQLETKHDADPSDAEEMMARAEAALAEEKMVKSFTLHPVRGVVWAAFWGTPVAAGIVMAINYSRLGKKTAALLAVAIAVVATLALIAVLAVIPEDLNIPNFVFIVPQLIAVYLIANALQGDLIRSHAGRGGAVASAWASVGVGLLCLVLGLGAIVGIGLGIAYLLEPYSGEVVEFGNDEVYYSGEATEEDARKLAEVLREIGFFGSDGASVMVESSSGQYTISFVLVEDAWEDPAVVNELRGIGRTLVESGFPTPLTIELCDGFFAVQKVLEVE